MITLSEIKKASQEYVSSLTPTDSNFSQLEDVLVMISTLPTGFEREQAIQEIVSAANQKNLKHLLPPRMREYVKEFRQEAKEETKASDQDFFEGNALKPIRVVDVLMKEDDYLTLSTDEKLRIYQDGIFAVDDHSETQRAIISLLGDEVRSNYISDVTTLLKHLSMSEDPVHHDWINLANGRWCLKSWKLLPHSPVYRSTVQVPVTFEQDTKCPNFDAWLSDVLLDKDDQFLLLQLIGYSMLQDVRFGKIAVLYGPTHTGKSTCLDLLKVFLGNQNVSALSLHALDNEDRRFTRAGLVGKLANISADLSSKYLAGDSQIKQIAVGDPMQVEFKGVQSFAYSPFATLWASANQLTVSHDRTDAWYERLIILPFMNQHKGKSAKRTLLEQLTQPSELSGILNRVLGALQVLLSENVFRTTKSTDEMLEQYRQENDHVERFLSEHYHLVADETILEDDVFDNYKAWAENEGIKALSKTKVRDGVTRLLGSGRKRLGPKNGQRCFYWVGMSKI